MLRVEIPRPSHVPNLLLIAATHHRRGLKADPTIAILSEALDELETETGLVLHTNQRVMQYEMATELDADILTEAGIDVLLESAQVVQDIWTEGSDDLFTELAVHITSEG